MILNDTVPTNDPPGAYQFYCSQVGSATVQVHESVPIINSGGVIDDSNGTSTFPAGTSGYLRIYGIALTAGGQSPMSTLSGDDPGQISLTISYTSDKQINARFSIASGTTKGTHSLWVTTAIGKSNAGTFTVD